MAVRSSWGTLTWLALAHTSGCAEKGDDSSAAGESDTDTDADADTDTDTDTDVGWHADTVAFDLSFGWDSTKGQVTPASANGEPLSNDAWVTLFNLQDSDKAEPPTKFCALRYALDGAAPSDSRFASYWLGFDLGVLAPEVGAETDIGRGDCEGLARFIDVTRGVGQPVDEFVAALGFGLGIGSWDNVDFETEEAWEEYWKKEGLGKDHGEWTDLEPYFALAGFTSAVGTLGADEAPKPFGVTYAYTLKKGAVTMKDQQGVALDVSTTTDAPTAYYETQALYIYGTAF
jgi:hypothetical protein